MRDTNDVQPWLFPVEPYEGESFSHFLGRFRRRNHLSPGALGDLAGVGGVVARWERFHLNPFPSDQEFQALAEVVGVNSLQLRAMLPPTFRRLLNKVDNIFGKQNRESVKSTNEPQ